MCTPKRNLRRSARRASYIELRPEEYQRAATRPAGGPREVAVETSALERGQRRQCLDQDFLRRVLCVLRVIKHADGDVIDPGLVADDQFLESGAVTGFRS